MPGICTAFSPKLEARRDQQTLWAFMLCCWGTMLALTASPTSVPLMAEEEEPFSFWSWGTTLASSFSRVQVRPRLGVCAAAPRPQSDPCKVPAVSHLSLCDMITPNWGSKPKASQFSLRSVQCAYKISSSLF